MPLNIELFHYWRSSCSWRVRWALALKKVPYTSTPVNLLKNEHKDPQYLKLNPAAQVPTLVVNGVALRESLAIIEWLDEKYPAVPLLPQDPLDRAKVRELAYSTAINIQPIQNLKVLQFVSHDMTERTRFAQYWIKEGLAVFEKKVVGTAGTYCFGGQLTLADLCLVPQVYNALRFGVDMTLFPITNAIASRCLLLPECDQAAPHNQPGAQP